VRDEAGKLVPFPQCGGLQLGTDVVVGRYTCIDRGALSDTIIGNGVKIDNLCHIAHGVEIGDHTSIAALTCIEGSVKIGAYCTIGSNVTFQIGSGCGDHVTVGSGSVVTKYIPEGETWVGSPARKLR
jgi:UDP-3-O-[3-hydroxymyristoyl] glucosamine N-acyltransferase